MISDVTLRKFRPIAPKDSKAYKRAARQKQQTSRRVFGDANTVQRVLGYLGPGYWLTAAPVCKQWYQSYIEACLRLLAEGHCQLPSQRTLYSTAFTSPAAVKWAHAYGLQFDGFSVSTQRLLGMQAEKATLMEAQKLGLPCCFDLMRGAAAAGNLQTLQLLYWTTKLQMLDPMPPSPLIFLEKSRKHMLITPTPLQITMLMVFPSYQLQLHRPHQINL